jgi:DNA-binding response OmpR family regulator
MKLILIVEDEKDIALLVAVILQAAGYRTHMAYEAVGARKKIKKYTFDKILLDLNLGSSLGLDLMPAIRAFQFDTEVIVVSAYSDSFVRKAVRAEGIKKFLKKPFNKKQLLLAME